ncbi:MULTISPECIES: hypothetical protein [unclassified Rhizobium]|uniref:hypothetical protein n=1 Tax=unclassified Rhizobium TaxID=2613769 RepID=UPI000AB6C3C2|nr:MULTISPECIES: hypothetical protein [unclassified Rhizobium]
MSLREDNELLAIWSAALNETGLSLALEENLRVSFDRGGSHCLCLRPLRALPPEGCKP